jgi:hypothetical protein
MHYSRGLFTVEVDVIVIACIQEVHTPSTSADFRSCGTQFRNPKIRHDRILPITCLLPITIFPPHVTTYKYCRRNSVVKEATKQFHPHHVFIYAPYEKAIHLVCISSGTQYIIQHMNSVITIYDIQTSTCFGTVVPSSGSHCNKG